jgi:hypothetical protein
VGLAKPPPFLKLERLLAHFAPDPAAAHQRLADFIDEGLSLPHGQA